MGAATTILGIDPARSGGEGMTLTVMKRREGSGTFEIVNSWPRFWNDVPEGCMEVGRGEEEAE